MMWMMWMIKMIGLNMMKVIKRMKRGKKKRDKIKGSKKERKILQRQWLSKQVTSQLHSVQLEQRHVDRLVHNQMKGERSPATRQYFNSVLLGSTPSQIKCKK